jgi:hypothetical protein
MFELYKSPHYGLGTCVEVHIDKENQIIKRQYKDDAITVNGSITKKSSQEVEAFFMNEIYWLEKLQGPWLPMTLDVNMATRTIIQDYTYPDLLTIKKDLHKIVPDIEEQIIEMYKFFKQKGVYKRNGSLSNLSLCGKKVIAFDFKWATKRPEGLEMELRSYDDWLSKISLDLPHKLRELL